LPIFCHAGLDPASSSAFDWNKRLDSGFRRNDNVIRNRSFIERLCLKEGNSMTDVEKRLRRFLKERFGDYRDDISATDPLDGVVDSLGLFELVAFIEEDFSVSIPNEEFSPQLFSSIEKILQVIDEFRIVSK